MSKFTQEDFLKRAKEKFGNRYDYSITKYEGSKKNIQYICNTCKTIITQYANDHLKGKPGSCLCRKYDTTEEKIKETFEDKENYEILSETRGPSKVKIKCLKHNYIFTFYTDRKNKCLLCKRQENSIKKTESKFHFNYDYSKTVFFNKSTSSIVICKKHGEFLITEEYLSKGGKCPKCLEENKIEKEKQLFLKKFKKKYINKFSIMTEYKGCNQSVILECNNCGRKESVRPIDIFSRIKRCGNCDYTKKITKENFLERAKLIHGDKYEYDLTNLNNSHSDIKIKCKKHLFWFEQKVYSHLNKHGCPLCCESSGEREIRVYLEKNKINFIPQKTFSNLKDINLLSYDFYLPDKNLLIEFNGLQHYKFCNDFHKTVHDFYKQKHHDWLKRKYAKKNKLFLLIISYKDDIIKTLKENLI